MLCHGNDALYRMQKAWASKISSSCVGFPKNLTLQEIDCRTFASPLGIFGFLSLFSKQRRDVGDWLLFSWSNVKGLSSSYLSHMKKSFSNLISQYTRLDLFGGVLFLCQGICSMTEHMIFYFLTIIRVTQGLISIWSLF